MHSLLMWLQAHAAVETMLSVAAAVATALFTAINSYIGLVAARASRQALPVARVVPHPRVFNVYELEIANLGQALARDVVCSFRPDPHLYDGPTLSEAFNRISALAPGERISTVIFAAPDEARIDNMFPERSLTTTITWRDASSLRVRRAETTQRVDQYFGTVAIEDRPLSPKALEELVDIARVFVDMREKS